MTPDPLGIGLMTAGCVTAGWWSAAIFHRLTYRSPMVDEALRQPERPARRPKPAAYTPPIRCGSYPLMNIAQDYGVAYDDVLVWADFMRRYRAGHRNIKALDDGALAAYRRIAAKVTPMQRTHLSMALERHANARWGNP